jgi:MFS transporter, DHA1 family, tetracycline resistance protein
VRSTPAIRFILVTIVLDVLGFGLLIPVGPKLVEQLMHGGRGGTEAEAAPLVGLLMMTWSLMSFLFAPILGGLSDRVGRRPIILISLLGSGLDYFAQALAPSLGWLFITRAINGVSGAAMTVANAYIADVTPPEGRAAAFGKVGAAFGIGFVIGPLLGGILGGIDIRLPFYAAGALTLVNWLYGWFVLPESLPRDRRTRLSWARANPAGAFGALGHYPMVAWMAGAMFLLNMAQFGLHATWVLYTAHRFGWDETAAGWSLFAVGVSAAVVQGGLARPIIAKIGEKAALLLSLLVTIGAFIGYGLATEGWMMYVVIIVGSLGGISMPAAQSLITRAVRPTEQGSIQGAITSLQSVAGIIGPVLGGWVMGRFISPEAPFNLPGASFFVSAGLSVVGWVLAAVAIAQRSRRDEIAAEAERRVVVAEPEAPASAPPGA